MLAIKPITTLSSSHAPLLLIYGAAGIGKTTIGLSAPKALYIPVHPESPPKIEAMGVDPIMNFKEMMDVLRLIYKEPHGYTTIVIDSLDAFEPMVQAETARRNGWRDLEQPSYGKGWVENDSTWRAFIAAIDAIRRRRGIMVIWLALAESATHEDPGAPPYKKYTLRLHKRAEKLTTQAADAVLFINTRTTMKEIETGFNNKVFVADGGGTRWAFTDARPAFLAKNRFNMPDAIMLNKEAPWAALDKYLQYEKQKEPTEAELPFPQPQPKQPELSIPEDKIEEVKPQTKEEAEKFLNDAIPI